MQICKAEHDDRALSTGLLLFANGRVKNVAETQMIALDAIAVVLSDLNKGKS